MMYKTLSLVLMFALFFGVNESKAQDPCDCITEIGLAVDKVVAAEDGFWVTPAGLTNMVEKLEALCDGDVFYGKGAKTELGIVAKMILVATRAINDDCLLPVALAPEAAKVALQELIDLLENGCEIVEVEVIP